MFYRKNIGHNPVFQAGGSMCILFAYDMKPQSKYTYLFYTSEIIHPITVILLKYYSSAVTYDKTFV